MDLALRDGEIDAVEGDDLAEGLGDRARANGQLRRPPELRRAVAS
jgi:hypothetical protein